MNPAISQRRIFWGTLLFAVAVIAYLPGRQGQYLHDDINFILGNNYFAAIQSFWDCVTFHFQPTRPVANFFLAFAHWIGEGTPLWQRQFSIAFHGLIVVLLYLNLSLLWSRLNPRKSEMVPVVAALWFAVAAVQSESIYVAQFRSEILAVGFTLSALLLTQLLVRTPSTISRRLLSGAIFLCIGLAVLSKEVFVVVAPLTALGLYHTIASVNRRVLSFWIITALIWGGVLAYLHKFDADSFSPHGWAVHVGALSVPEHLKMAGRSLIEEISKAITGTHLSPERLSERPGLGSRLSLGGHAAILTLWLIGLAILSRRKGWNRFWALSWLIGTGVYLAIPNINMGSEHYVYFSMAAICALAAAGLEGATSKLPKTFPVMAILAVAFAAHQTIRLENRLHETKSPESFYLAELSNNPSSINALLNLTNVAQFKGDFTGAHSFLNRAREAYPNHPFIVVQEFLLAFKQGDLATAERDIAIIDQSRVSTPNRLAHYYWDLAQAQFDRKSCNAVKSAERALSLAPDDPFFKKMGADFQVLMRTSPPPCEKNPLVSQR